MPDDRWEHGSDFAYPGALSPRSERWLPPGATTWQSGRDALRALVRSAPERFRRVWFPSFYCQDVPLAVARDGVDVRAYADDPRLATASIASLELRAGDAVVVSNTFGLRRAAPLATGLRQLPPGVTLVEDHTHDPASPWALGTRAAFAFSSLRKWLPIPDGAILWSGQGLGVPAPPAMDAEHASIALARLSAMLLKARYLAGESVEKATFRALAVDGEQRIGEGSPGPMSPVSRALLDALPVAEWRAVRRANHDTFVAAVGALAAAGVEVISAVGVEAPYAVTLLFPDASARDRVRGRLVAARVYPAVLWPVDEDVAKRVAGVRDEDARLAARVLSIHCDQRYTAGDMERVASVLDGALRELTR